MRLVAIDSRTLATSVLCATELRRKLLIVAAHGNLVTCAASLTRVKGHTDLVRRIRAWSAALPRRLPDDIGLVASDDMLADVERRLDNAIKRTPALWKVAATVRLDLLAANSVESPWVGSHAGPRDMVVGVALASQAAFLVTDDDILLGDPLKPNAISAPQTTVTIDVYSVPRFLESHVGAKKTLDELDGLALPEACRLLAESRLSLRA